MPVATLDQTLPMFPNDNSLSADYFEHLMGWLVRTEQVPAESAAMSAAPSRPSSSAALIVIDC